MKSIKTLMISAVVCGAMVLPVFSSHANIQYDVVKVIAALWVIKKALHCDGEASTTNIGTNQFETTCTYVGVIRESLGISTSQMEAAQNKIPSSGITQQQVTTALETLKTAAGCNQSGETNTQACEAIDATIQGVAETNNQSPDEMMDGIQEKQEDASGTSPDQ